MAPDNPTPNPSNPQSQGPLSIAALLRCAADGELTTEQEAALCAHLDESPGCTQRIEFEQRLREACSECYSDEACCPDTLRSTVSQMCEHARDGELEPGRLAPVTRTRSFWNSPLARGVAVAAVLVLMVTLAFQVGQKAGPVDGSAPRLTLASQATQFVSKEHLRCEVLADPDVARKFTATTPEQVPAAFEAVMGKALSIEDLIARAESVKFIDAGRCGVPGTGRSMHVRLATLSEGEPHSASLFVQEDAGDLDIEEGPSYHLAGGKAQPGKPCVFVWRGSGLVFWLVCDRTDAQALRQAVGAPELATDPI